MKKLILLSLALCSLSSTLYATSTYRDHQYGNYVSKSHLYDVFQKVKERTSVSQQALAKTFYYYEKNRYRKGLSRDFLAIADYTKPATQKRLFIINLHSGKVRRYLVAHGKNSGVRGGRVWKSSNRQGSRMTPFGFFKIGDKEGITYKKKYKYLTVEGLEWKNRNAQQRDILLHTASYVARAGRSYGCFAILPQDRWQVFSRLKTALFYSYTGR